MVRNYLKVSLRDLFRNRIYSVINIIGLVMGLVCCGLIWLFVQFEYSFDAYHADADKIFRVVHSEAATSPAPLAPLINERVASVAATARIDAISRHNPRVFRSGEKSFYEDGFILADPSLFDVFSHEFVAGRPETALTDLSAIVISESIAQKYFGSGPALGQVLEYEGRRDLVVTGIIKDVPRNSHFMFDMVASFANLTEMYGLTEGSEAPWGRFNYYTYVRGAHRFFI
jgi:putative ABC transport system permease protein